MMRIEYSDMRGVRVVCVAWNGVSEPVFEAKQRPLHSVPLFLGHIALPAGGGGGEERIPIAAVLPAGSDGEPDWRRGCGVLIGQNVSDDACPEEGKTSIFDCMVKAVVLAEEHGIIGAKAAEGAKYEITGLAGIKN